MSTPTLNGTRRDEQAPDIDLVAAARAEAIRREAEAKAEAEKIRAQGEAAAARLKAEQDAERQRLLNEQKSMQMEERRAAHEAKMADLARKKEEADLAAARLREEAEAEAQSEAERAAEQQRAEALWKWGARSIYLVGLVIAAPVQFLAFWDEERPFLIAAPALLEGVALVLAAGAAWAVANRRDVLPYRVGIMLGALIAAAINLWHGLTDEAIGLNAGLIGALASLGGPVVLMAYEHGIAQKADGIPSWRERRAAARAKAAREAERAAKDAEKETQAAAAEAERAAKEKAAEQEQKRRDADRQQQHPEVWKVADAMRSAQGAPVVTERIWADAWYHVTGSKTVGITPEIEARSRAAQARMKAATQGIYAGAFPQVDSQKEPSPKRDPGAPDGRRFNGGTPPRRTPGDTPPYNPAAKRQAAIEQTTRKETAP